MPEKDPKNLSTQEHAEQRAFDHTYNQISAQLQSSIAPLALEVDCAAIKKWAKEDSGKRFRHNYLIKELKLWAELIKRKPIKRFWLNDPLTLMDAPGLTEFVFAMAKHLSVHNSGQAERATSLPLAKINKQNVALLRGLEFNHLQVSLNQQFDLAEIVELKQLVNEFKFNHLSYEVSVSGESDKDSMRIVECLSFFQPTSLILHPNSLDFSHIKKISTQLMQLGYSFQAPNRVVKFNSPLMERPAHVLNLGPQAISFLGEIKVTSLADYEHYCELLNNGKLPVYPIK